MVRNSFQRKLINCFIFSVGECHHTAFILNKHYHAEISMFFAGYSITSIVQMHTGFCLKSYFTCVWTQSIITR